MGCRLRSAEPPLTLPPTLRTRRQQSKPAAGEKKFGVHFCASPTVFCTLFTFSPTVKHSGVEPCLVTSGPPSSVAFLRTAVFRRPPHDPPPSHPIPFPSSPGGGPAGPLPPPCPSTAVAAASPPIVPPCPPHIAASGARHTAQGCPILCCKRTTHHTVPPVTHWLAAPPSVVTKKKENVECPRKRGALDLRSPPWLSYRSHHPYKTPLTLFLLARVARGQGVVQGVLEGVGGEGGVEGASGPATPLFITLHRCTPEVSSAQTSCNSFAGCQGEARCILSTASSRPSPHPRQCVPCLHHLLEHHNPPDMSLGCSACTDAYVFLAHEKQKLPANAAIFHHHQPHHHKQLPLIQYLTSAHNNPTTAAKYFSTTPLSIITNDIKETKSLRRVTGGGGNCHNGPPFFG